MEWLIWIPIAALALLCPLMMIGMIVGGWMMARGATAGHEGTGHSGHGMMCMMHGLFQKEKERPEPSADDRIAELDHQLRELREERDREREKAA